MSAADAVLEARAAGIQVCVAGTDLVLVASAPPQPSLIEALSRHKAEIVAFLATAGEGRRAVGVGSAKEGAACITPAAAEKTAAILAAYGVKTRLLTTVVDTMAATRQLLTAAGPEGVIGADIETAPLERFKASADAGLDPYRAEVRVLSLWNPRGDYALVIDLRHVPISALPKELWAARLAFHNATFDTKHLLHLGAPLQPDKLLCSMLGAGFVSRGDADHRRAGNRRPGLAVAAKELLGVDIPKNGQAANWARQHLDPALQNYAGLDAVVAYQVLKAAIEKMEPEEQRAFEIACSCIYAVARLELEGLPFDAETHRATALGWVSQLAAARTKATELTGIRNLNSAPQKATWLAQSLPAILINTWPRGTGGSLSTESKVLRRFTEHHPGLQAIAEYSKLSTLASSFGLPLFEKINPVTKRLHTNLQIAQAKSGRFSSKKPGLQNLPRGELVRGAVRAPVGSMVIVADYNQIELRVMAEVACDKRMREAYARGLDLHAVTAACMLGIAPDQFDKRKREHAAARQKAKGVNFGIIYGCGAPGLVAFARDIYGIIFSEHEARQVITTWLQAYPDVASWQERQAALCKSSRRVQTPAGRTYHFAWEPNGKFNYNLALNLPIQGGAAEVAQIATAKIDAFLCRHLGEQARLVGQVHDEFLVVAGVASAERAKALLVEAMTAAFSELFPDAPTSNLVDSKIAVSWAQAKE